MRLGVLYVIFACVATTVNLATQEITDQLFPAPLAFCIFAGTLTGLITKYLLDKKYIFAFQTKNQANNLKTFLLYSTMGVLTTIIFWFTEYAFDAWFQTKTMRYVGAIIGLSIGYITKYQLDKRFVFIER